MDVADPALQAAWLLAIDPQGLGGLCLRGPPGPARDAVLAQLRAALPEGAPWRRLPAQIDDERLLGGLDLGLSLAAGRPVAQAGLLAEVAGGVLLLPMAERLGAELAGRLAMALDRPSSGLCCVALDEGQDEQERPPACLTERLALIVACSNRVEESDMALPFDLAAARQRLTHIPYDEDCVQAFCATAAALGLNSLRAPWQAWRAACAAAALAGRERVAQEDAELAARLVLAPRARAMPEDAESAQAEQAAPPESAPAPEAEASTSDAGESEQRGPDLQEQVIEAAKAAIPSGLLAWLSDGQTAAQRATGGAAGRSGAASRPARSGRPLSSRRGSLRAGARLDLLATLRAAIPWQRLRLQERERAGLGPSPAKLLLRRDDFHIKRYRRPCESTTIFAVDASGSQALSRLAEAKGAVELLLADCYVRRDRVALIAFRGESAQTLLAPTRSLVRARRSLSALPGGGGTPLAAGIDAACALGQSVQARDGAQALLVFLTDARANIASDGSPGRALAMQDALAAAARLRAQGLRSVLIDTSPRPQPQAVALAQAMAARYVPLPQGQAADVHAAVAGRR
ncbi:MAG: magnesium chelatase subunit D [Burkholderiaceae bacterium]|nr:magnesium chelatase subunit D [Burkholderiaceae bacterium]